MVDTILDRKVTTSTGTLNLSNWPTRYITKPVFVEYLVSSAVIGCIHSILAVGTPANTAIVSANDFIYCLF